MKTNLKRTKANPAFKQRQVLPVLPSETRVAAASKSNSAEAMIAAAVGNSPLPATFVTTE